MDNYAPAQINSKMISSEDFNQFMHDPDKKPMLQWPSKMPGFALQQLHDVFKGKDYSVCASILPLETCTCRQNCPALTVNITECRNFGLIPVALCRFSYSWKGNDRAQVDDILRQCGPS